MGKVAPAQPVTDEVPARRRDASKGSLLRELARRSRD